MWLEQAVYFRKFSVHGCYTLVAIIEHLSGDDRYVAIIGRLRYKDSVANSVGIFMLFVDGHTNISVSLCQTTALSYIPQWSPAEIQNYQKSDLDVNDVINWLEGSLYLRTFHTLKAMWCRVSGHRDSS